MAFGLGSPLKSKQPRRVLMSDKNLKDLICDTFFGATGQHYLNINFNILLLNVM